MNCGLTNESPPTLPVIIERALKSAIACSCVSSHGCDRGCNRTSLWNLKVVSGLLPYWACQLESDYVGRNHNTNHFGDRPTRRL